MTAKLLLLFSMVTVSTTVHAVYGMPDNLMTYMTQTKTLPNLNLDRNSVTVSGISSGGFMAVQLGVAFSSEIRGVGVVAGGVYECADGNMDIAKETCMKDPSKIDVNKSLQKTKDYFQKGWIDDPQNIKKQNVFLLQGTEDIVVGQQAGPKLQEFYSSLGAHVTTDFKQKMGHGFPADHGSNVCRMSRSPWVNDCGYSGAGMILRNLYGPLKNPTKQKEGLLAGIDQSEFGSDEAKMLDYGHLYVPNQCRTKAGGAPCRLHVAIHGCLQAPNKVGGAFVSEAGYNEWADTNGIVILYPAVSISGVNPGGCWDWFGYTGKDYAVKSSKQAQVIMKMVDRLTGR
jgi:poly(3-hydroxybutyrate) depolymerase